MNWLSSIDVSINYIENHLTEKADVAALAKLFCCSTYEFQRLFSFVVGTPLSDYILKRRLTMAGMEVQAGKDRIIDIAVKYQYDSHSSFTRAFKEFHNATPSQVRKNRHLPLKAYPKFSLLLTIGELYKMDHRIIELPVTRMARSGDRDIREFGRWWPQIAKREKGILFPKDFWWNNEKTGRPEWLYAIPEDLEDTNGYEVFKFPGGLYAVTTAYDTDEDKSAATHALIQWINESGCFELANEHNDETYHRRYGMGHISSPHGADRPEFTIFLPIVKKV